MKTAQAAVIDGDRSVAELQDNPRRRSNSLDDPLVCSSCRDPEAAPRALAHESRNPWLSKLVCTLCGAPWRVARRHRRGSTTENVDP